VISHSWCLDRPLPPHLVLTRERQYVRPWRPDDMIEFMRTPVALAAVTDGQLAVSGSQRADDR
jgi:hypothetical protein